MLYLSGNHLPLVMIYKNKLVTLKNLILKYIRMTNINITGTCFIQKIYAPSSSLLQGKHLPFTPSPLRLNIFCLFVILSQADPIISLHSQALVSLKKYMPPSSSLLQGKHLPFTPSPLRLNSFRLFVILSLTQLYLYTPEIFLFSTATFKYKYRPPPSDELDKNIQRKSHFLFFSH